MECRNLLALRDRYESLNSSLQRWGCGIFERVISPGVPRFSQDRFFPSLGTSDFGLVMQSVMFYSLSLSFFFLLTEYPQTAPSTGEEWPLAGSALKELKLLAKVWHHENKFEAW